MNLPTFLQLILKILNRQGIKADVVPMYGSCSTKYVITLPGVVIDKNTRNPSVQPEKTKLSQH